MAKIANNYGSLTTWQILLDYFIILLFLLTYMNSENNLWGVHYFDPEKVADMLPAQSS